MNIFIYYIFIIEMETKVKVIYSNDNYVETQNIRYNCYILIALSVQIIYVFKKTAFYVNMYRKQASCARRETSGWSKDPASYIMCIFT